ncbi:MAG: pilin [Patescibacteria group bacterium]
MFKKISFLIAVIFAVVSVFSFMAVNNVLAVGEYDNCSSNSQCESGLSCQANPWFNDAGAPNIVNSGDDKICCSAAWGCLGESGTQNAIGLGSSDPREIAARVINILLGFLGIIAVVLILVGGFMWMTAAGNDDKVATAKKVMVAGVIGLVIVLAAFGIAKFVVSALLGATT